MTLNASSGERDRHLQNALEILVGPLKYRLPMKCPQASPPFVLGIEAGGTRTIALLADRHGRTVRRIEAGAANLRLVTDAALCRLFRDIAQGLPQRPAALGIGMAGVRNAGDHGRIFRAAQKVWPGVPCTAGHDLETALCAADHSGRGSAAARIVVLSGTGSCCFGRNRKGQTAKVGGWGHLLGDKASGYEIGLRALKAVVYYYDRDGVWPALGRRLLRVLQLNVPNDLIDWAAQAGKRQIAALAVEVFAAWDKGDRIARDILEAAVASLAKDAVTCAAKLAKPKDRVDFVLTGGVLLRQPRFARWLKRVLQARWPGATVGPLGLESVWGAVFLAQQQNGTTPPAPGKKVRARGKAPAADLSQGPQTYSAGFYIPPLSAQSPTERRNPKSAQWHRLPIEEAIALMVREESTVSRAVLRARRELAQAVRMIVRAFRQGGRLFYVGAGTSGRLGVLDASECPPTFQTDPSQVQGIMAGGAQALWRSVEGAEDNVEAGAEAICFRGVRTRDVVVGITASGRTPFVWGALQAARARGAETVLLCFNPHLRVPRRVRPGLVIALDVGPEVLTGSTRLKAGTATKIILNLLSTVSMLRLGKIVCNLMVDLQPSNEKLRDRATRILQELTGAEYTPARKALVKARWNVRTALVKLRTKKK